MKILYVINNLGVGGAEKLTRDVANKFNNKENQVEILMLNQVNDYIEELNDIKIQYMSNQIYSLRNLIYLFKNIKYLNTFNVIHVNLFPALYYMAFISFFINKKVKLIYTEHSTFNKRRKYNAFRILEKIVYKRYNRIIAISSGVKVNLIQWIGESFDKNVYVINNGIDTKYYNSGKKINLFQDYQNEKIITMIASFDNRKNHAMIIESIEKLPNDIHLVLVGKGRLEDYYKKLVKDLNLSKRIHFLGLRLDIPNILSSTDIFVLCSNWEGFGLVAVEAMAAGIPVVATDVHGLQEVVSDYGILVDNNDIESLVNSINLLISDNIIYEEYKNKSLERAEMFDIPFMIEKLSDLYFS